MKRILRSTCALALAGCVTPYPKDIPLSIGAAKIIKGEAVTAEELTSQDASALKAAYDIAGSDAVKKRRAIIMEKLKSSDAVCEKYMQETIVAANTVGASLGIGGLALSAAAGVSTPVSSANLLAAGASLALGSRTELSSWVLGGFGPDVLWGAVMAGRAAERARLDELIQEDAGLDVVDSALPVYHGKCGPTYGRVVLTEMLNKAAIASKEDGAATGQQQREKLKQPNRAQSTETGPMPLNDPQGGGL